MTDQQEMAVQRQDAEWTDATQAPTEQDYRELQAQHDQLQSKYKAALDILRDTKEWGYGPFGLPFVLEGRIAALLAGQVPNQLDDINVVDIAESRAVTGQDYHDLPLVMVPEGWQLVPVTPVDEQYGDMARAIVFWMRSYHSSRQTPATLEKFITSLGYDVPKWMAEEAEFLAKDHVISKSTVAVLIYKAMLSAAPKPEAKP